jgi:hypothetical protein
MAVTAPLAVVVRLASWEEEEDKTRARQSMLTVALGETERTWPMEVLAQMAAQAALEVPEVRQRQLSLR